MSAQMNCDNYANGAGTGKPTFPYGLVNGVLNYYTGYMSSSNEWEVGPGQATFADIPLISGSNNNLTTIYSTTGLVVTPASTNYPGVTFTPSSSSALYLISANCNLQGTNAKAIALALTDGTTYFAAVSANGTGSGQGLTLSGLYLPGGTSPVSVRLQGASQTSGSLALSAATTNISSTFGSIYWQIYQIAA